VRRHLVHEGKRRLLSAERDQDSGYANDPNRNGDLEIADDQSGSGQSPAAFSGPFDLPARHVTEDDAKRIEEKRENQSRDRHSIGGWH
jgi:hypothetical protein